MPHFDTATATLLNEEALQERGEEWEIEGEFDPDLSFVQLQDEGSTGDPLTEQVFAARNLVRARESGTDGSPSDLFATGISALDGVLQGGIARGEMIEILGAPGARTSGRFSLALATLSMASRSGEQVALVDLGDHLDPQVAERAGIDLERLLWLRPSHIKQALGGAELLLTTGFPLVVLDLGTPPVPGGRDKEASWLRLARAAQSHRGALLVSSPYRASGTAATAVVEFGRGRAAWWAKHGGPVESAEHTARAGHRPTTGSVSPPSLLAGVYGAAHLEKGRARLKQRDVEESLLRGSFGLSLPSDGLADLDLSCTAPGRLGAPRGSVASSHRNTSARGQRHVGPRRLHSRRSS